MRNKKMLDKDFNFIYTLCREHINEICNQTFKVSGSRQCPSGSHCVFSKKLPDFISIEICNQTFKVSGSRQCPSGSHCVFSKKLPDFISIYKVRGVEQPTKTALSFIRTPGLQTKIPCSNRSYSGKLASKMQEDRKRLKNARSVWLDNGRPDEVQKVVRGSFKRQVT